MGRELHINMMEEEGLDECKVVLGLGLPAGGHGHKLHPLFPLRPPNQNEGGGGGGHERKKLRLTQQQATLLEDTFREHHTLSCRQKHELAEKLRLRPRQVEVWFQNRRARNKLKRTEVDFQILRKWCVDLREENRRLESELHELKLMKVTSGTTTLTLCPSCDGKKSSASGDSSICLSKELD